jgi:hypothetical protein
MGHYVFKGGELMRDFLHIEKYAIVLITISLFFSILVFPQTGTDDNLWPMWLHDSQRTARSTIAGPGCYHEIEFKALVVGAPYDYINPPVIDFEGILYLQARLNGQEGVYAFYPSGTLKWFYPTQSWATGQPNLTILKNGYILTLNTSNTITVLSRDGIVQWQRSLPDGYRLGAASYPALGADGTIYINVGNEINNMLLALSPVSGDILWSYTYPAGGRYHYGSSPAVGPDGTIYFGNGDDTLYAVGPDGVERWRRTFPVIPVEPCASPTHPYVVTPSIGSDGTLYVIVAMEIQTDVCWKYCYQNGLHAIDPANPYTDKWPPIYDIFDWVPPVIGPSGNIYITKTDAFTGYFSLVGFDAQGNPLANWPSQLTSILGGASSNLIVDNAEVLYVHSVDSIIAVDVARREPFIIKFNSGLSLWGDLSIGKDGTLYIVVTDPVNPVRSLYAIRSKQPPSHELPPPPPPTNLSPANGAVDVSLYPHLEASPPLQGMDEDSIPWERFPSTTSYFTKVESQWQISKTPDDFSAPVFDHVEVSYVWKGDFERNAVLNRNCFVDKKLEYETTYYWRVRYRLLQGPWSEWSTVTSFTTREWRPPKPEFSWNPKEPEAGKSVTLDASRSSGGESPIAQYAWDLNGDGEIEGFTTSPVIYYRWEKGDTYNVTLWVRNEDGDEAKITKTVTVRKNPPWESMWSATVERIFDHERPSEKEWKAYHFICDRLGLTPDVLKSWGLDEPKILMALRERIDPEVSSMTIGEYILQVLHDIELVDTYLHTNWPVPQVQELSSVCAKLGEVGWVDVATDTTLNSLKEALKQAFTELGGEGGEFVGAVFSVLLKLPKAARVSLGLVALYRILYSREFWLYINGYIEKEEIWLIPQERLEYYEKLKAVYAEPLSGPNREQFKEARKEELRDLLQKTAEKYKFWQIEGYSLKSPGELRVYDSQGRVTGVVQGVVREEIPGSAYVDGTVVIFPASDSYTVEILGTEGGTYSLIAAQGTEEMITFNASNIPIAAGSVHVYTINWDALRRGEEGATLRIDQDGDGVFDQTIQGGNQITGNQIGRIPIPTGKMSRQNFEGQDSGTSVLPPNVQGRLENNDTLVLIVRDKTDERNIAASALKIIDTNAKITVTPNPVSYSCSNCSNITVRIEDPDENLSPNYIESVPFFVIVNPGSWNPQNSGVNDFCSLLRRGGYNPSAGADLNQPMRWYNIYDEPVAGGPGWPSSLFSRWIQYPASWLEGGRVVGRALFFANETERNSGVFEYNFGRLEDLQKALGFARFPAGTTISFYYIDPNDFDDMDLAVIWVGNRPHSEVYLTDSGGIPVSEVRLGLGYEGLYVKVYDADANVEACCPDKVVVHICDPHNEDDSEYWVIDEVGANSGVFSSQSGMPLLPVWDAVGGYQLVFDDWKVQAFNEDTVLVRYNSVAYLEDDLNRLGDGNPNDGHFPPRIDESTRNQCWDVSFAKAKVYDFQVFDGGTNQMRFLDGNYQPVTEIPISGSLYLEVTDLDQNEHPGLRELIFGGWNKDAFGPQDSRPLWPGELETFLGLRGFSITGIPKTVKIFMFNAQRGTWERMDLRETGLSTGIFRSTTYVLVADSRNPGEGNLGSRPGDTIMAFYQDPSNHSDISIIQIKVSEGGAGGVTPPTAALSVAFDKATYYPGDTVTITVTDEQYSGAAEIVGPNILVLLDNDGGLITSWDKLKAVAGQPGRFQVSYVLPETVKLGTITAKYTDPSMPTRTAQAQATVTKAFEKVTGITVTPNPFKTLTAFVIQGEPAGAVASKIRITIYDLTGARVAELSGTNTASITWDGGNLRNGAYIYVAQVESAGKVFGRFKGFVYIER